MAVAKDIFKRFGDPAGQRRKESKQWGAASAARLDCHNHRRGPRRGPIGIAAVLSRRSFSISLSKCAVSERRSAAAASSAAAFNSLSIFKLRVADFFLVCFSGIWTASHLSVSPVTIHRFDGRLGSKFGGGILTGEGRRTKGEGPRLPGACRTGSNVETPTIKKSCS